MGHESHAESCGWGLGLALISLQPVAGGIRLLCLCLFQTLLIIIVQLSLTSIATG